MRRSTMRAAWPLVAGFLVTLGASPLLAGKPPAPRLEKLWGQQTKGTGPGQNARTEGNKVTVKGSAKVVKVEGDAPSYCIWKRGVSRGFLCGSGQSILGQSLPPGTYTLLPALGDRQSRSRTTVTLQSN